MALLSGPALEITVPAILEEERRKRFNIQGDVYDDDTIPGLEALLGLGL